MVSKALSLSFPFAERQVMTSARIEAHRRSELGDWNTDRREGINLTSNLPIGNSSSAAVRQSSRVIISPHESKR
jgi:hypothetical protein